MKTFAIRKFWFVTVIMLFISLGCGSAVVTFSPNPTLEQYETASVKQSSTPTFNPRAIERVAVLVQPDRKLPVRRVEDEFIVALLSKGYQVIARSDVKHLLREIHFQSATLTDSNAIQIGKLLNVPAVLIVRVTDLYKETIFSDSSSQYHIVVAELGARLVEVQQFPLQRDNTLLLCSG